MSQGFKKWINMLNIILRNQLQGQNIVRRCSVKKSGIRVSPHRTARGQKSKWSNFISKWSSWLEFSQNMIQNVIWTRIDQEIKITCKRGNLEKLRIFTKLLNLDNLVPTSRDHNLWSKQPKWWIQSLNCRWYQALQISQHQPTMILHGFWVKDWWKWWKTQICTILDT